MIHDAPEVQFVLRIVLLMVNLHRTSAMIPDPPEVQFDPRMAPLMVINQHRIFVHNYNVIPCEIRRDHRAP